MYACEHGFKDSTASLIQAGADVMLQNREGFTGQERAATTGRNDVISVIDSMR